ncbi:hypothetical protein AX15_005972 [Amanita polypyramis BW_CC]|nr:hypothetical protein AX15_005972 [Amanita polypyramis BW_CC]
MIASRIALFVLPALAAATAVVPRGGGPSCSTGPAQCCNSAEDSSNLSQSTKTILGLLNIDIGSLTGLVGVTCVPIVGSSWPSAAKTPASMAL